MSAEHLTTIFCQNRDSSTPFFFLVLGSWQFVLVLICWLVGTFAFFSFALCGWEKGKCATKRVGYFNIVTIIPKTISPQIINSNVFKVLTSLSCVINFSIKLDLFSSIIPVSVVIFLV